MNYISFSWNSFAPYYSASSTQLLLQKCYEKINDNGANKKSYENCYPFIYYIEHGQLYFQQAENAPITMQPILLFYGLVHLIKACILTVDPNYPETTSVLAHGVSTRKKKRQQYSFFQDEVKIQKNGLFPFMSEKLFHMKQLEGDKICMGDLLKYVPELNHLFMKMEGQQTFIKVNLHYPFLSIPKNILDYYHMTEDRFIDYFHSISKGQFTTHKSERDIITFEMNNSQILINSPLKLDSNDGNYSLPISKGNLFLFPELLIHYLLLYNLSMIARYEIEWWSELIKTMPNKDYPFIYSFLNTTMIKGPQLILEYLNSK
ncbi:YaaC family protein [Bacillus massilinigeriensis]|uniref:YaaC family protein n=1 Tax=Bacillus massilionigeriensis TaxID=1805475 RepID=UPI00096AEEE6|nr:YaaC family protein [Bacillus massilionigeriensis]